MIRNILRLALFVSAVKLFGLDEHLPSLVMGWVSVSYTFTASTTIKSAQVNQNFTDLVNAIEMAMPSNANGHGIILWSGAIANIPSGWYLCDGANGTPDLRDKFVIGAGLSYSVNAAGGAATKALSVAEMPGHTHSFSGTTSGQSQDHGHWQNASTSSDNASPFFPRLTARGSVMDLGSSGYTTGSSQDHSHTFSGTTGSNGSGSSFSILPPYKALAFIMKS